MLANLSIFNSKVPPAVKALAGAIATFVILNVAILAAAPYFDSNYSLMSDINDEAWIDGADVLFLGDSRTHQAMIPAVFSEAAKARGWNVDAMNLARPGMQIPFMYFIANRVINDAKRPPKAIVINLSFYLLGGDQWMRDIYLSYYRPSLSEMITSYRVPFNKGSKSPEWYFRTRIPGWEMRARVDTLVQKFIINPRSVHDEIMGINEMRVKGAFDVARGYLTRGADHISEDDIKPSSYSIGIERGYSVYFKYLDMLIEEARTAGVQIYIYRFPWPEQRQSEDDFRKVADYYWDMLKKHSSDNVTFLNEMRFWPIDYFIDPLHLNESGAEKLSAELGSQIASLERVARAQ